MAMRTSRLLFSLNSLSFLSSLKNCLSSFCVICSNSLHRKVSKRLLHATYIYVCSCVCGNSPLARRCCVGRHAKHGKKSKLDFIYDCKQFVLRFFLRIRTRLILGLGPQTKPLSMTAHHGLVTSQCVCVRVCVCVYVCVCVCVYIYIYICICICIYITLTSFDSR